MQRRALLSTLGLTLPTTLAGCLGGVPTAGDGDGSPEDGSGGAAGGGTHPRFTETSLTSTGQCERPGTASVAFGDEAVTVTGCAHGRNGCAVPVLADVSYTPAEDHLTVVIASEVRRDEDEACTEALLPLGYEARVVMDGAVPGTVSVVHDDVDGRREVVRGTRDGA
ncbi:hypothetical protein C2R22_02350 [Salinigranum rubrum]|uniref:Uncharacterized protein n=1 Tax=Salinigranum rubrum TaxID=755307 RepID=A0A2I8VFD2_9EURY|nr:hypothetical protein [Salinigranum rubrum]AUV80638.1 hypothetical protein C2R22_02350 [Salinigranum rubrum]